MGKGSVVCPACGGAAPKAGGACPYCGAATPPDLPVGATSGPELRTYCTRCGQFYPASAGHCPRCPPAADVEATGRCPRCGQDLAPETMNRVTVERCTACKGLWFDGDEIEHAIDVTTRGRSLEEAAATRKMLPAWTKPVEGVHYLHCARCGEVMARRQVAPRTGVIIDICRPHGVWFDAGEFEHFQAFAAAGGLELVRLDGVMSADARRRLAAVRDVLPAGPGNFEALPLERDFFDWVGRLLDRLFHTTRPGKR